MKLFSKTSGLWTAGLLAVAAWLAAPSAAQAAGVTNGGFETGDMTGWTPWGATGSAAVVTDVSAPEGSYVAEVTFAANTYQLIQDITTPTTAITPGLPYTVSVWYRYTTNNPSDYPQFNWFYYDAGGANTSWNPTALSAGETSTWTKFSTAMVGEDNPTLRVILYSGMLGTASGTAWFDDLQIVYDASTPLLNNNSFETGDLTNWITWPVAGEISVVDDAAAPDGAKVLQIGFAANNNGVIQDSTVASAVLTSGTVYTATTWCKLSSDNAGDVAYLAALYMDSGDAVVGDYHVMASPAGGLADWTPIALNFPALDAYKLRVRLMGGDLGNGTAMFDNVLIGEPADIGATAALDFGTRDVADGQSAAQEVVIENNGVSMLVVSGASLVDGSMFALDTPPAFPLAVDAGSSVSLMVTFTPQSPNGSTTDTLRIVSSDPDQPQLDVDLSAVVVPVELSGFSLE